MATTIRIRDADKERLDRLQAELTLRAGRKVSQEEILERLLALGERNKERLVASDAPPTKAELAALMALPMRTGDRRGEAKIDADLYGESA